MLLFLLRSPDRFNQFNPSMCILDFTIWRVRLNHQSVNWYTPHNIKIFRSFQRATINPCLAVAGMRFKKIQRERERWKDEHVTITYVQITEWEKLVTIFWTICERMNNSGTKPMQQAAMAQSAPMESEWKQQNYVPLNLENSEMVKVWFSHWFDLSLFRSTISQKSSAAARMCKNIGSFVVCANSNCFSKYLQFIAQK